ncbi:hypothetical protein ACLOJK_004622, partial [Asimina triloba]
CSKTANDPSPAGFKSGGLYNDFGGANQRAAMAGRWHITRTHHGRWISDLEIRYPI